MQKIGVLLIAIISLGCGITSSAEEKQALTINDQTFQITVRDTPAERAQGLMHRPSMPENEGMWFVFDDPGIYSFWMKNTLIPLDIIWVDEAFVIVDIQAAAPCPITADDCPRYTPKARAQYVLELNQ